MSAINDALRRASSAAKTNPNPGGHAAPPPLPPAAPATDLPPPPAPPSGVVAPPPPGAGALPPIMTVPPGLLPASDADAGKKRSKVPVILTLVFLFCLLGAGAAYRFGKRYLIAQARERLQLGKQEVMPDNERLAALFGDDKTAVRVTTSNVPSNFVSAKVLPTVVPAPAPAPAPKPALVVPAPVPAPAPVVARAPVHFPPLRLQSIFFRPENPCVMINGKTLFVDDEINGVKVADIQPANVTLVLSGQTNILTLR